MFPSHGQAVYYNAAGTNNAPIYGFEHFLGEDHVRDNVRVPTFEPRVQRQDGKFGDFSTEELWRSVSFSVQN